MVFGVVCEFNPFHKGHKYLFDKARELGADSLVCVMSGNATQRGELAIADKYVRSEAAVREGADLVLELPFPWCAASAEYFARGAVSVLSELCDVLVFGSECGDTELLVRAAQIARSESFREEYAARLESGCGAAEAYFSMLREKSGVEFSSNDLLGIEYIRAIKDLGSKMKPLAIKREGSGYRDARLDSELLPSATALREEWRKNGVSATEKYLPVEALKVYAKAEAEGELTDISEIDSAIVSFFRLHSGEELSGFAEAGGGVAGRLCSAAHESVSAEELLKTAASKRYTDAKLRRAMLFSITGVTQADLAKMPQYTSLLALAPKGREILAATRKSDRMTIVTKPADAPRETAQFRSGARLDALFTLATRRKKKSFAMLTKNIFIK